jgi:CSLREA domain-containing protein
MKVKLNLGLAALVCAFIVPGAAIALTPGTTITVNTTADVIGGPDCTLRDAITAANSNTTVGGCNAGHGADIIDFSVSGQINLGSTLPAVASDLTIDGSSQSIVVSGQGTTRVLEVGADASLTLDGLTIADGVAANAGGILNSGTLLVTNSTLSGNRTENFGNGGGIWNTVGGILAVEDSTFSGNGPPEGTEPLTLGAGIYNDGKARVESSTFADNEADHGGGIFNAGRLTVRDGTFTRNSAGEGGAIHNIAAATLSIANSSFVGNFTTVGSGGAISSRDGTTVTVANSIFSENGASDAGAIASDGTLIVAHSTFEGNGANGGGAIQSRGTFTVTDSTFTGNSALSGGGVENSGTGSVRKSTFAGNDADEGGAIGNVGSLTVTNSTFSGNTITSFGLFGGGIFNAGRLTVKSSTFSGNSASESGGIANLGTATLENTIVAGNTQGGNCSGAFTTASTHNMSDDATCSPGFTQVALADLRLGPLADNGGPTQTIALGPGSVAINAGDNAAAAGLITDQRGKGFPRIVNGRVDVGAFEVQRRANAG